MTAQSNEEDSYRAARKSVQAAEILRVLSSFETSGSSNDRILYAYLDTMALGGTIEQIRTALDRLEQIGLLRSRKAGEYLVVTLTDKGDRVARGSETVDGVARPSRDG